MSNSYSNYWEEERKREEGGKEKRGRERGERKGEVKVGGEIYTWKVC